MQGGHYAQQVGSIRRPLLRSINNSNRLFEPPTEKKKLSRRSIGKRMTRHMNRGSGTLYGVDGSKDYLVNGFERRWKKRHTMIQR